MRTAACLLTLCALVTAAFAEDTTKPAATLPKVVLLGDSVRGGYAPFVVKLRCDPRSAHSFTISMTSLLS